MVSDEDKALFRKEMQSVKPLHSKTEKIPEPKEKPLLTKAPSKSHEMTPCKNYSLSDYIKEDVGAETTLAYTQHAIPKSRWQDLKKGSIPWEARLDLHGFKPEEARWRLCDFIYQQSMAEKRCLLIIHGKSGRDGNSPVLKNLINRWLPQFEEVLAFCSSQPKDGGAGAVYVLLKRVR